MSKKIITLRVGKQDTREEGSKPPQGVETKKGRNSILPFLFLINSFYFIAFNFSSQS
jgi:hypothetical protein